MTQGEVNAGDGDTTSVSTTTATQKDLPNNNLNDNVHQDYPTTSIAAVTIAVLAVVIVLTLLLVFRALRKRRRERRGEQFGERHIPTLTTGVMGTGGGAYSNSLNSVPVRGQVSWESVNPSAGATNSGQNQQRR